MPRALTIAEARRMALAAQGFDARHRAEAANWGAIRKTLDRIHLLQIDSVNVLVRSHYLPLYARLGAYSRETLDARTLSPRKRHAFECWAHEASLVPLDLHHLMRWRMDRARRGDGVYAAMDRFGREESAYLDRLVAFVEKNGPTRVRDVPDGGKSTVGWWGWGRSKLALETLFDQGRLTTAARDGFERIYDIPERVIPAEILGRETPSEREAFRQLTELSARALGVGTAFDVRDYFRLPVAEARQALADCLAEGSIVNVEVEGWKTQAFMHRDAKRPRAAGGTALLSPFDPIVWYRDRAERLFDFHYRIELYTPGHKRKYGYYVLPFLMGERLVGRVCLKADREEATLKVNAAHVEPEVDASTVAKALAEELRHMADWLGLRHMAVARTGNLAATLRRAA